LYVIFPHNYPIGNPELRFITPIYHCNINDDGKICHEILNKNWSPLITMTEVFDNIINLLMEPNADDALDVIKAALYKDNRDEYIAKAKQLVETQAKESEQKLCEKYKLVNE